MATFYDAFLLNRPMIDHLCSYGTIRFYPMKKPDEIGIHCVVIDKWLRRKGIFTNFLHELIDKQRQVRRFLVLGVGTWGMIHCLEKFEHDGIKFCGHGGDYIWARDKIPCKCHTYEESVVKPRN